MRRWSFTGTRHRERLRPHPRSGVNARSRTCGFASSAIGVRVLAPMACFGPYSPSMSTAGTATVLWFMDYRNADGSIAEMCGNGIRVFVPLPARSRPGQWAGRRRSPRGGLKVATALPDGRIRVTMGRLWSRSIGRRHNADGAEFKALTADVGNPHAVSFVDNLDLLLLHAQPRWDPAEEFPGRQPGVRTPTWPSAHRHARP